MFGIGCVRRIFSLFGAAILFVTLGGTVIHAQESQKAAYGILFDNTGSMRQLLDLQREIALLIAKRSPGAKVSIFGFASTNDESRVSAFATGIECSTDMAAVEKQIAQIGVVGGQTTFLDAVHSGVVRLVKPAVSECSASDEQILIVMSDGEDRASTVTHNDLVKAIKASGVKLYIVGLISKLSKESGFISESPRKKAKKVLVDLALNSGGRLVLPGTKETASDIVQKLFAKEYTFPK